MHGQHERNCKRTRPKSQAWSARQCPLPTTSCLYAVYIDVSITKSFNWKDESINRTLVLLWPQPSTSDWSCCWNSWCLGILAAPRIMVKPSQAWHGPAASTGPCLCTTQTSTTLYTSEATSENVFHSRTHLMPHGTTLSDPTVFAVLACREVQAQILLKCCTAHSLIVLCSMKCMYMMHQHQVLPRYPLGTQLQGPTVTKWLSNTWPWRIIISSYRTNRKLLYGIYNTLPGHVYAKNATAAMPSRQLNYLPLQMITTKALSYPSLIFWSQSTHNFHIFH